MQRQGKNQVFCIVFWFLYINTVIPFETEGNNSEIFVSYSGHNEASNIRNLVPKPDSEYKVTVSDNTREPGKKPEEDIVFIPNEKPVFRNEDDYLENNPVMVSDMMNNQKISDVIDMPGTTGSTNEDILFISGKNNENVEHTSGSKKDKHTDTVTKIKDKETKRKRLDCSKLDCDNSINSICGGKMEDKKWRFRLFLNECFFRKVNCAFKYPNNRYKVVEFDKCSHIRNHSERKPDFQPIGLPLMGEIEQTRRAFSSRRSLNADLSGQSCSHPCPITCTERYEPQCAVSSIGQYRTFLNHCKLDYNSCLYKVVWHTRPLSECVGGKKADVQQNRGFIAWMQKVGIVDNRGRLTLSKEHQHRRG